MRKDALTVALESGKLPEGETAESFAGKIKKYVVAKNTAIKSLMIAFSVILCALALFVAFGRESLMEVSLAAFWAPLAVLLACAIACAALVAVNMYRFKKFLKLVEGFVQRHGNA